jgi:hypothetical protein
LFGIISVKNLIDFHYDLGCLLFKIFFLVPSLFAGYGSYPLYNHLFLNLRLGPPDFHPQTPNCPEETLTNKYVASGYKEAVVEGLEVFFHSLMLCHMQHYKCGQLAAF